MSEVTINAQRAERRAAPKPARLGNRSTSSSDQGLS